MSLKDNQVLLLDNLIYLDTITKMNEDATVGDVIDSLLNETSGTLEKDRFHTNELNEISEKCKMNKEEWIEVLTNIKNDEKLSSLKITNYEEKSKCNCTSGEDNCGKGFRAVTLKDGEDSYVIFRGTSGDEQWHDNGEGAYSKDLTINQKLASEYVEKEIKSGANKGKFIISGHSKGANLAQTVGIWKCIK